MNDSVVIPTYNKIAQKYTDTYFNDVLEIPRVDKFISSLLTDANVLDIGCGPGNWTKYLMDKGFDVEGIDLSTEMIRIAKEKVPQGKFKLMDMRKLDYPDETFDGIMSFYSLIHIPSEQIISVLRELFRVLKSSGVLMLVVQEGEADRVVKEPMSPEDKTFINFFTIERLTKFLEETGFKVFHQEKVPYKDEEFQSENILFILARK